MDIGDRVRILQAKGYLARATYNLLLVIADQVRSLDGHDEDTDPVIGTVEAALDRLHAAMTCIVDSGEQRGTITDHVSFMQRMNAIMEFVIEASVQIGPRGCFELEVVKLQVQEASNLTRSEVTA